jgi:hypothetical protein
LNIVPRNLDICFLSAFYKKALIPQLHFLNAGFLIFCRDEIVWIDAFLKLFFVTKYDNICQNGRGVKTA